MSFIPFAITFAVNASLLAAPAAAQDVAEQSPKTQPATQTQRALPVTSDAAVAWLEKLEAKANDIDTLNATLRRDSINELLGDVQKRFGTFTYSAGPPARFRATLDRELYETRPGRFASRDINYAFIFDGRWLAMREHNKADGDSAARKFTKTQIVPANEDPKQADALALGKGPFNVPIRVNKDAWLKRFAIELIDDVNDEDFDDFARSHVKNAVRLRMHLRHDAAAEPIDVWYDRTSMLPVLVRMIDETTTYTYVLKPLLNEKVDEKLFDTSAPEAEGWEVQINPLPSEDTED